MNYDPEKKFSCGCKCSICSEIIKITLYIIVELILFSEQHTIIYNIFLIIRVFLMALSLLSLFILIIYGLC